jgi:two-component system, NarL family, sensor histidine kinase DesK
MRFRLLPPESHLGWTPYAWLIYLSFYVVSAFFGSDTTRDWVINSGGLLAFLALYFPAFWLCGRQMVTLAFAIVGLGVLLIPFNPGANAFFIYGAAFLGEAVRPREAVRWLLLIVVILGLEAWLVPLHWVAWVPGIVFSLVIGGTNIHFGEVRRKEAALLAAEKEAQRHAAIAERERIARDLHDLLGHTLSVIVIKSELAAKLADRDPQRAAAEIRDVEQISRQALKEVREAIYGYRGGRMEQEVENGRKALAAAGVVPHADLQPLQIEPDAEQALALAVREALTNVLRHARAQRCDVRVERTDVEVRVIVQDDGIGSRAPEGSGLSGIRARLAQIGGTVLRDGSRGTRIEMTVPVSPGAIAPQEVAS